MWITILIFLICSSVGIISISYLGKDNPVEEISEEIIEKTTGIDVDFSPGEEVRK